MSRYFTKKIKPPNPQKDKQTNKKREANVF